MERDIKKYNERIARFVGASIQQCKTVNTYKWVFNSNEFNPLKSKFDGRLVLQELHFHDDLNWAIEVLRLIESRGCIVEIIINLGYTSCRICVVGKKNDKTISIMHDDRDGQPIDAIYNSICEYLDII